MLLIPAIEKRRKGKNATLEILADTNFRNCLTGWDIRAGAQRFALLRMVFGIAFAVLFQHCGVGCLEDLFR